MYRREVRFCTLCSWAEHNTVTMQNRINFMTNSVLQFVVNAELETVHITREKKTLHILKMCWKIMHRCLILNVEIFIYILIPHILPVSLSLTSGLDCPLYTSTVYCICYMKHCTVFFLFVVVVCLFFGGLGLLHLVVFVSSSAEPLSN